MYTMNIFPTLLFDTEPMFVVDIEVLQVYKVGATSDFDVKTLLAYHHTSNIRKKILNQAAFSTDTGSRYQTNIIHQRCAQG